MTMNLTHEETLALANAINSKAKKLAQTSMAPTGLDTKKKIVKSSHVDFTVRITGDMGRAADLVKESTCSIPLLATCALLLRNMGCTRDAAVAKLVAAMQEAMDLDTKAKNTILAEMGVAQAESDFKAQVVSQLPKTPVLGKVAHDLEVTKVA